mgnify:CR=1 FL=1
MLCCELILHLFFFSFLLLIMKRLGAPSIERYESVGILGYHLARLACRPDVPQ